MIYYVHRKKEVAPPQIKKEGNCMSDKERQEVINLFKNNIKGYIAINDIQEAITSITYLFWNKKYLEKVLSGYSGTIIIISHDKDFLQNTTNKTLEIKNNTILVKS